jgi:hypothetical protein
MAYSLQLGERALARAGASPRTGLCPPARRLTVPIARIARVQLCFPKSFESARLLSAPRRPLARSLDAPSSGTGACALGSVSRARHTPLQEGTPLAGMSQWPTPRAGSSRALLALAAAQPTHSFPTVPAGRARAAPASIAARPKRMTAPKRIAALATSAAPLSVPAAPVPLWRPAQHLVHGRACSGTGGGARGSGEGAGGGGGANRAGTLLLGAAVASMVGGGTWYYHYQRQGRQTGAPLGVGVRVAASAASLPADTSGAGHGKGSQNTLYRDFMA